MSVFPTAWKWNTLVFHSVRLQGDINCRDSDHAVPSTVCSWYPQQLRPTTFNTKLPNLKKKKKWLVRMAFLSKGLCTYFSRNLRFIFAVPQAAHLRAGRGCREQTEAARVLVPSAGSIFFWHRCSHGEQSQPSLFGNWHLWQRACSSSFTC